MRHFYDVPNDQRRKLLELLVQMEMLTAGFYLTDAAEHFVKTGEVLPAPQLKVEPERDHAIVIANCEKSHTTHIQIDYSERSVKLAFGKLINGVFHSTYYEVLLFSEYPELRSIRMGDHWCWDELWALVLDAQCTDPWQPFNVWFETDGKWQMQTVTGATQR